MEMNKDLIKELKKRKLSLCEKGVLGIKDVGGIPEAVKYFFANIDYCLVKDFPPKEYFKKFERIQCYGIYVDEPVATENRDNIVTFGNCSGTIEYTGYAVGRVYVKHNTKLTIKASEHSFVLIDIFDNAEIEVISTGSAKIRVYEYGEDCKVTATSTLTNNPGPTTRKDWSIEITKKTSKTY